MLKIDTHNHILPKNIPDFKTQLGEGGFIKLNHLEDGCADMIRDDGVFFRKIDPNCFDIDVRLKEMDQFNVDVQVLSTVPVMFSYWAKPENTVKVSKFLNQDIAEQCEKHPKRFVGLGTIPMQSMKHAVEELEYCVKDLGLRGVQIGSHFGKVNLDNEELYPFYQKALELDASIMVHPWDMMGKETMPDYWLPWLVGMPAETTRAICSMIFGGIFDKFPGLKVLFAHGGGSFPGTIGRIEHGFKVRPDLCAIHIKKSPREYLDCFYIDSIAHDPKALTYILDLMGPERVALGTDYPFPLGELEPGKLIESRTPNLTDEVKKRLLAGTALEWLGMKESDFI